MTNSKPETSVRISVRDDSSKHNTSWNDDYTLLNRADYPPIVFRCFEKPDTGPRTTMFRNENLDLPQVPGQVADVFDEYVDGNALGLQTTGSPANNLGREEATITTKDDQTTYKFNIFDREYIRVKIDGSYADVSNVPPNIRNEIDQYTPSNADFIR